MKAHHLSVRVPSRERVGELTTLFGKTLGVRRLVSSSCQAVRPLPATGTRGSDYQTFAVKAVTYTLRRAIGFVPENRQDENVSRQLDQARRDGQASFAKRPAPMTARSEAGLALNSGRALPCQQFAQLRLEAARVDCRQSANFNLRMLVVFQGEMKGIRGF
jgi:hypothetical protein